MDKLILVCLALCLLAMTGRAENSNESQTLDSLISVALEKNPAIQANRSQQSASEYKSKYAGWLPDPKLTMAAMNLPRSSLSFDETPMSGFVVGLSQTIPWPGKSSAKGDIAQLDYDIKGMDLLTRENNIVRQVKHFYYEYSYSRLVDSILARNKQLISDITEVARTRYANGEASLQDVLRSETSIARIENRILMIHQQTMSALTQLARLTDNPETMNASLPPYLPTTDSVYEATPSEISNPMLSKMSFNSEVAKRKLDLAGNDYWPDLMIGVDYNIRKYTPMDAVAGEDYLSFKVGFNLPLWFFAKQKNQSKAARETFIAAQADERAVVNEVIQKVNDVELALNSLQERIAQYDEAILPQAESAAEAARVAYEVGQVDFNGYLSSQLDIMNIGLERLDLLKQFHQRRAELQELTSATNEVTK